MANRKIDGFPVREPDAERTGRQTRTRQPRQPAAARRRPADVQAMARRRRQTPSRRAAADDLSSWIAKLPRSVQPLALLRQYPRIANMMAGMWQDPHSFRAYLHDLLTDRRGSRKGFPPEIVQELLALRVHYEDLHPAMLDVYKDVDKRG